jgi:hypothetical protein
MKRLMFAVLFVLMSSVNSNATDAIFVVSESDDADGYTWFSGKLTYNPEAVAGSNAVGRIELVMSDDEAKERRMPFLELVKVGLKNNFGRYKTGLYIVGQPVGDTGASVYYWGRCDETGRYVAVVAEVDTKDLGAKWGKYDMDKEKIGM